MTFCFSRHLRASRKHFDWFNGMQMRCVVGGIFTMHIHDAGGLPSFTSRYGEFLTLFEQRQDIIKALKEIDYIASVATVLHWNVDLFSIDVSSPQSSQSSSRQQLSCFFISYKRRIADFDLIF